MQKLNKGCDYIKVINKKTNKIIILSIIFIIIFMCILTTYKLIKGQSQNNKEIINIVIEEDKKVIKKDKTDKELYSNKIIKDIITSYDYELEVDNKILSGKVYIGTDKYLYITDEEKNTSYRVSNIKIKTLYKKEQNSNNALILYAISKDNKLNEISLYNLDTNQCKIHEYSYVSAINFVDVDFENGNGYNAMILSEDDNIYDGLTGIRYEETIIKLGNYYIYNDNTILDLFGNMLKDENGKYLKIKYYIVFGEDNLPFNNKDTNEVIITEDNSIIYLEENQTLNKYNSKIKTIKYEILETNEEYNLKNVKINIQLDNNSELNWLVISTKYYGFK